MQCCHGTGTGTWDSPGQDSPGHVSYFLCPGHIWDIFRSHDHFFLYALIFLLNELIFTL